MQILSKNNLAHRSSESYSEGQSHNRHIGRRSAKQDLALSVGRSVAVLQRGTAANQIERNLACFARHGISDNLSYMQNINRSLMVVKPKQPFLDWVSSLDDEDQHLELEDLRDDSTAYLIPEFETFDERMDILEWCAGFVFDEELRSWYTDEDLWPAIRDAEIFVDWFDIEFHSLVLDLEDETPLQHIHYDDQTDEPAFVDPRSNGH